MAQHHAYDTDKRIIYITTAPTDGLFEYDVQIDLYSDIKEDWLNDASLNKFALPIRSVGGDPLPGSKTLGDTYFLDSDWKIRPYEADHKMAINGNLFSEDGTSVIVPTIGSYNVLVEMFVSNLSDSSIQQLTEIEYATYNGGITIDVINGEPGNEYPIGTPARPVNNLDDLVLIKAAQSLPAVVYVEGDLDITSAVPSMKYYSFYGGGMDRTILDLDVLADVEDCAYYDAHVTGTLDGNSRLRSCLIDNLTYIKGYIEQCVLSEGTIVLGGSETAHFLDCWSGVPGSSTPVIDCGGSGQALALRNYNGGITLRNKTGTDKISIDLNSGQCVLENTVSNGEIVCRGVGKLVDTSGYTIETGTWNGVTITNETTEASLHPVTKITMNKVVRTGDEITVYEDDGVTIWKRFDLSDDGRVEIP